MGHSGFFTNRRGDSGMDIKRLILDDQGALYRNRHPGHRAECAFLPNVVPITSTELLWLYRIGQAFYSVDGKLVQLRSADGGKGWWRKGSKLSLCASCVQMGTVTAASGAELTDGRSSGSHYHTAVSSILPPWQLLLVDVAGWINRQQLDVIA